MAVVQNPIIGRAKKSFSTATFTKIYNQNVMRSKPTQVANPKSLNQTSQRSAFKQCIQFSKEVLPAVKLGFQYYGSDMSPYSYSLKENQSNAVTGSAGSRKFDKTKFVASKGSLEGLNDLQGFVDDHTGEVSLTWTAQSNGPNSDQGDKVQVIVYHEDSGYVAFYKNHALRQDESIPQFTVPTNVDVARYHVIVFLTPSSAIAKKRTSDSQNILLLV